MMQICTACHYQNLKGGPMVGTPPNAIVFGSHRIKINEMARTGFWMNMIGIILTTALMFTLGRVVFGI